LKQRSRIIRQEQVDPSVRSRASRLEKIHRERTRAQSANTITGSGAGESASVSEEGCPLPTVILTF
jgi:hypothetical protein